MSSSPLQNLPREILDHIFGYIHTQKPLPQDLQSLRLTCRRLNEAATPWLFRRFYLGSNSRRRCCRTSKHGEAQTKLMILNTYGYFVREVQVREQTGFKVGYECRVPIMSLVEQLPLIQHLDIFGHGGGSVPFETNLKDWMHRASLLVQPQDRALQHLRSVQLVCESGDGIPDEIDVEILFLMPQLRDLEIRGVEITSNGLIDTVPARSTGLKSLHLESCRVDSKFLITLLSLPSALVRLCLMRTRVTSTHDLDMDLAYHEEFRLQLPLIGNDVVQGMLQQRHSLKWAFFRPNPRLSSWLTQAEGFIFDQVYDDNDKGGYSHYNYWRRKMIDNKDNFPTLFAQPDWDCPIATCVQRAWPQRKGRSAWLRSVRF